MSEPTPNAVTLEGDNGELYLIPPDALATYRVSPERAQRIAEAAGAETSGFVKMEDLLVSSVFSNMGSLKATLIAPPTTTTGVGIMYQNERN